MRKTTDLVTMPEDAPPRAMVGFFHGGGFVSGSPDKFRKMADALVGHGIGSVSFAYRTHASDGTMVRDAIDDARNSALNFKAANPATPIFFSGTSAGGVLAVHAALRVPTAGVVLFNPVLDLSESGFRKKKVLAGDEVAVSPLHIPLDAFPPTLIFHGAADTSTPIGRSAAFVQRLRELGISAELVRYEGIGHRLLKLVPLDTLVIRMVAFIAKAC